MTDKKNHDTESSFDNIHRNSLRPAPSHQYNKNLSVAVSGGAISNGLLAADPDREFYGPMVEHPSLKLNLAESQSLALAQNNQEHLPEQGISRMVSAESDGLPG